ncbi:hypothetical protein NDN08_001324 [Rhodosorus marinus]|uniref:Reverse transcriptase Ty1/copia-type domain-containing protein n=1 Tax=Rhodosorus marinus TaxID=101924 RepID=A0AAV8URY9_9RHOD|nr:hypothetical protein NDN08_001324 [Rhodosorus marinus]
MEVCKLEKRLYGLKQAGRTWDKTSRKDLEVMRYEAIRTENCIFTRDKVILGVSVDDMIVAGPREEVIRVKADIEGKYETRYVDEVLMNFGVSGCNLSVVPNNSQAGLVQRFKARLVAKGFAQTKGYGFRGDLLTNARHRHCEGVLT